MFLTGEVPIIVSTGVLAVDRSFESTADYVHQVGRASRMGDEGTSIIFVNEEDKKLFKELVQTLKSAGAAFRESSKFE
ncbi:DEAD-box ATP-dependent RNA helicase 41, partial [Ananas comosus]